MIGQANWRRRGRWHDHLRWFGRNHDSTESFCSLSKRRHLRTYFFPFLLVPFLFFQASSLQFHKIDLHWKYFGGSELFQTSQRTLWPTFSVPQEEPKPMSSPYLRACRESLRSIDCDRPQSIFYHQVRYLTLPYFTLLYFTLLYYTLLYFTLLYFTFLSST